jgi:hypothetical protein
MTIRQWLNNPSDFETGRLLYDRYGKNGHLKQQFAAGRLHGKLIYELGKLVGVDDTINTNNGIRDTVIPFSIELLEREESKPPIPLVTIEPQKVNYEEDATLKKLYQERSILHQSLRTSTSKEARKEAAERIEELTDQIEEIILPKSKIKQTESIIDHGNAIINDIGKLKRIQNLKTYISKHKNNPKRTDDVVAWTEEKERLEKELNNEKA